MATFSFSIDLPAVVTPTKLTEEDRLWGRDVWFDGDYRVAPAGDWLVAERSVALRQALIRRWTTPPGAFAAHPGYGAGALDFVKARKTQANADELAGRIREQSLRDPRVLKAEGVAIEWLTEGLKIRAAITPRATEARQRVLVITTEVK